MLQRRESGGRQETLISQLVLVLRMGLWMRQGEGSVSVTIGEPTCVG